MHTADWWSLMVRFDHLWTLAFPSDSKIFAYSHVFKSVYYPHERHFWRIRARILTNMWGIRYASPRTPNVPLVFADSIGGCGVLKLEHSRTLIFSYSKVYDFFMLFAYHIPFEHSRCGCVSRIFVRLGTSSIRSCIRFIPFVILVFQQVQYTLAHGQSYGYPLRVDA